MNLPKISNCLVEPYYPYSWPYTWPYETWIGDFPLLEDKKRKDDLQKGFAEIIKNLREPVATTNTTGTLFDKQVWFNNSDGGQTFRLEVVGYGQEHISAEIKDSILVVSAKRGQKSLYQEHEIPSHEKLDLEKITAKVEHGLLEIVFPPKKTEVKSIKVL